MGRNGDDRRPTRPVPRDEQRRVLRFASLDRGARFAGRYRVIEPLGAGGSGEVYRVLDEVAEAEVALKVLYPRGDDDPDSLGRLRRELKIVRSLNHPGVPTIHDIGEDGGFTFLIMEFLEGETLRERIDREGSLSWRKAALVLEGVFSALAAAHSSGVVHRDIKPSNILLSPDDPDGGTDRVVLLDFGLARGIMDPKLTATGHFLGTPDYVSPEQARGERTLGPASDIYSAGIVLWEMLSGSPPFSGTSPMDVSASHITQPLPPAKNSLPETPGWLRDLACWMLEKDPARRPKDAGTGLESLKRRRRRHLMWRLANRSSGLRAAMLRPSPRRRVAEIVTASVLTLSFLVAMFLPASVEFVDATVSASSLLGLEVRSWDLPTKVRDVIPLHSQAIWSRRYLALLSDPFPADIPTGLLEIDVLSPNREAGVFRLEPWERWRFGPPHEFAGFDRSFAGFTLANLPWKDHKGRPLFLATYGHSAHYPSLVLVANDLGETRYIVNHPGRVVYADVVRAVPPDNRPLVVLAAVNQVLGERSVLFALEPQVGPISGQIVGAPPYDLGLEPKTNPIAFYAFYSAPETPTLDLTGTVPMLSFTNGDAIPVDLSTGAPADSADRGGLELSSWLDKQAGLLALLHSTSQLAAQGSVRDAADALAIFADQELAPSQAGVALARAAVFLRQEGDYEQALLLTERALESEQQVAGHARLLIDLLTRMNRWEDAYRRVTPIRMPDSPLGDDEINRDLIVGGLITGHAKEVEPILPQLKNGDGQPAYYGVFCNVLLWLHRGLPDEALATLTKNPVPYNQKDFALLEAVALSMLDRPQWNEALARVTLAEASGGGGQSLPLLGLRGYIEVMRGGQPPPLSELERELRAQRIEARDNIVDLYFLGWGEAFAARMALSRGDSAAAEEHRRRARGAGAGPYLELVLGEREGSTVGQGR